MVGIVRYLLNGFLAVLKWPLVIFLLCLLPDALLVTLDLLEQALDNSDQIEPFICGFVLYLIGWWILFKRVFMGSWFSTLEHELTHGLFAILTLHKVLEIKSSYVSGGHIKYQGGGNWLITISPYFFPTLSYLLMGILFIADLGDHPWWNLSLGVSVAYHLTSTWRETHVGQPDLKDVGFVYAWLFLIPANLISYATILAFILGGTTQVYESLSFLGEGLSWIIE